jgi:hypothetical protein
MAFPPSEPSTAHWLQKDQGYFWTGAGKDGNQALITNTVAEIYVLNFDSRGAYVGKRIVPLTRPATDRFPSGIFKTTAEFHQSADDDIRGVAAEMGLEPANILVQQFYDDDTHCGVEVIVEDVVDEGTPNWHGDGRFLLWLYGVDYWISADGRVHSHG